MPRDDYEPPFWWTIVQTAKYLNVHPAEVMEGPSYWVRVARAAIDIENHLAEVRQQRNR